MKLKRAYIYLLGIICLTIMFSICYYISYQYALNKFNRQSIERNQDMVDLTEHNLPTNVPEQESNLVSVDKQTVTTIKPSTRYILETYDINNNTLTKEQLSLPAHLVGLTREQVINYLESYMDEPSLQEYNKGLASCELLRFSEEEIVLRKTYDTNLVPFRFYLAIKDGYVIVYNSDLKSVHTYTYIEARKLPEEDRIALSKGIYIETVEELYSLLESYSS